MLGVEGEWLNCLKQGRQRLGFTLEHLRSLAKASAASPDSPWSKIAQTPFMRELAQDLDLDGLAALHRYATVVLKRLPSRPQLVASWTLNLDVDASYRNRHLGDRQAEIAKQLSITSVATFRSREESPSLREFAKALNEPQSEDILALGLPEESVAKFILPARRTTPTVRGKVTVVGAAVMDLNFVIPHMPNLGESVQAESFETSPGGKGLCQAVACARLGLDTALISVVGDDDHGELIRAYLTAQNVSVDLIEVRPHSKTAVVGVFTKSVTGGSWAIGWKNSLGLHFSHDFLEAPRVCDQLERSDFVLCSFELPEPVVSQVLALAKLGGATTIVTPTPPFMRSSSVQTKANIDYIVANLWELRNLSSASDRYDAKDSAEAIAKMAEALMIGDQIRNVIVTHDADCHTFLFEPPAEGQPSYLVVAGYSSKSESAGERDAFCAMLARRLAVGDENGAKILDAIDWATTAMGCLRSVTSVPESMPTFDQVEKMRAKRLTGSGLTTLSDVGGNDR